MPDQDVQAELERLRKENAALKAQAKAKPRQFSLKVSQKGAVSAYGMGGRFPVTLYQEQWKTLLEHADEIREFIVANESQLKKRD
ncbi:MAG: hypothetical protein P8R42_15825 [Candidatus Binatia bacterium]|nr:hypothetical protein [Candidatus Binatia bacterium]